MLMDAHIYIISEIKVIVRNMIDMQDILVHSVSFNLVV